MLSNVPPGVKVPTWSSYSTASSRGAGSNPASVQGNRRWSTTQEAPCTPSGCQGERGSGSGRPPSSEKA